MYGKPGLAISGMRPCRHAQTYQSKIAAMRSHQPTAKRTDNAAAVITTPVTKAGPSHTREDVRKEMQKRAFAAVGENALIRKQFGRPRRQLHEMDQQIQPEDGSKEAVLSAGPSVFHGRSASNTCGRSLVEMRSVARLIADAHRADDLARVDAEFAEQGGVAAERIVHHRAQERLRPFIRGEHGPESQRRAVDISAIVRPANPRIDLPA